jgi:hypothetical protein
MADRFMHVYLPPEEDPSALASELVRWFGRTHPGRVSSEDSIESVEVLIRIRSDAGQHGRAGRRLHLT